MDILPFLFLLIAKQLFLMMLMSSLRKMLKLRFLMKSSNLGFVLESLV